MEIDLLRSFVAVAAQRNFTNAAAVIGRTQSAVSLQIKRLEGIVGKRLFDRNRQSVEITPVGEALLVYSNRILAANDEALSPYNRPAAEGVIRIGAPDDYATFLLPSVLSAFSTEHPRIRFEVTCDNTCDLLPMLDHGDLDLVVATHAAKAVAGEVARYEPLHWVAAPDYVDDPEQPLSLVLFPSGCVCRDVALDALQNIDRSWHIAYSTRSIGLIEQALLTGSGVSAMEVSTTPKSLKTMKISNGLPALPDVAISVHQSDLCASHVSLAAQFIQTNLGGSGHTSNSI